jgi:hypothetical protein
MRPACAPHGWSATAATAPPPPPTHPLHPAPSPPPSLPPPPHPPQSGLPSYPVWSTTSSGDNGNGSPTGDAFIPAESDTYLTVNDQWFWKPGSVYRDLATLKQVRARPPAGVRA